MSSVIDDYVRDRVKSHMTGVVLAVLLGPLGLLYSTWWGIFIGIASLFAAVLVAMMPDAWFGYALLWLFPATLSPIFVDRHNARIASEARLKAGQ